MRKSIRSKNYVTHTIIGWFCARASDATPLQSAGKCAPLKIEIDTVWLDTFLLTHSPHRPKKNSESQRGWHKPYSGISVRFHSEVFVGTNVGVIISSSTTHRFKSMIVMLQGCGATDTLAIRVLVSVTPHAWHDSMWRTKKFSRISLCATI